MDFESKINKLVFYLNKQARDAYLIKIILKSIGNSKDGFVSLEYISVC